MQESTPHKIHSTTLTIGIRQYEGRGAHSLGKVIIMTATQRVNTENNRRIWWKAMRSLLPQKTRS
jgi:hypothetical protein